jgi:hypothetical protein
MRKELPGKATGKDIEKSPRREADVLEPEQKTSPFIRFHYSYREISSVNGRTRIRAKEKRFADGKMESEEFEGTLDGHVYENMLSGMQRQFLRRMEALMKPFSLFLPFGPRDRRK